MTCTYCTGSRSLSDNPDLGPCVCAPWSRVEHIAPGVTLYCGDSLEVLPALTETVHSAVVDPPYGLGAHPDPLAMLQAWMAGEVYHPGGAGFMGKEWDGFVPGPEIWREVMRLLPPGGHLLSAFGTRTYDLGGLAVRLAGFEIRDMVAWLYGCLSDDTEILVEGRWERFTSAIEGKRVLCYLPDHDRYEWQVVQQTVEYDYDDTAFRIRGDHTDQIVSRNHRCLVERGGSYVFQLAETLQRETRVPVLENVRAVLDALPLSDEGTGDAEPVLLADVRGPNAEKPQAADGTQWDDRAVRDVRHDDVDPGRLAQEEPGGILFEEMQRRAASEGPSAALCEREGQETPGQRAGRGGQSGVEGRGHVFSQEGELQGGQICAVPAGSGEHGAEGRLCDGAPAAGRASDRSTADPDRGGASRQPRPAGQSDREPRTVCDEQRPQAVRTQGLTRSDLAVVEPFRYVGRVWCVRVPSGAFVARRNGKVFVTGNSGFPKSLDVSKAIDKAAGAMTARGSGFNVAGQNIGLNQNRELRSDHPDYSPPQPITPAAQEWAGWGTALKPALEPFVLARKPLDGTVARNVMAHRTGALNIDACRVAGEDAPEGRSRHGGGIPGAGTSYEMPDSRSSMPAGRWPANLCHDGSDEVLAGFPDSKSGVQTRPRGSGGIWSGESNDPCGPQYGDTGSAARFFACFPQGSRVHYCAKASKADRNSGGVVSGHPTVKPHDLMRYLCRLVTPPGGTVLDPFMGSGSTGKAAVREGFGFIGIERDPEYFEIAVRRVRAAIAARDTPPG